MVRVETKGSIWMIDEGRYCRFPKEEKPRERPEWGSTEAGNLQDAVWHEYHGRWYIDNLHRLIIQVEQVEDGFWRVISAPSARVQ